MSEFKMLLKNKLQEEISHLQEKPQTEQRDLEILELNVRLAKVVYDLVRKGDYYFERDEFLMQVLENNIKEAEDLYLEAVDTEPEPKFLEMFKETIDTKKDLLSAMVANDIILIAKKDLYVAKAEHNFAKMIIERKETIRKQQMKGESNQWIIK